MASKIPLNFPSALRDISGFFNSLVAFSECHVMKSVNIRTMLENFKCSLHVFHIKYSCAILFLFSDESVSCLFMTKTRISRRALL